MRLYTVDLLADIFFEIIECVEVGGFAGHGAHLLRQLAGVGAALTLSRPGRLGGQGALASAGTSSGALHQTTLSRPAPATVSATERGPATTAPTGPPRERATVTRLPTAG